MDHPNIAKVLDGGATESGRPYFVMELVRGIRITEYCDQASLSTKERLDLFIKVCHAVQHAHQKGIIHRDIKPSNILVTLHDGVAVPKVIDFGIAKATVQRLTDKTLYTELHSFMGTPAYMSPEQAGMRGLDIDTRSDIYSLGVLLYELLSGSTPFDEQELMTAGFDAMRKTIREKEPASPSTRLATLGPDELTTTAKRRAVEPAKLMHQIKGDLDWIVMKCLEKDRTRRYETAAGLGADLDRHLRNEAVFARPPSKAYRFRKFLLRNQAVSTAAALVLVSILIGSVVSIAQLLRARKEMRRAQAAEADAQAALHFIQDDVLSQASPGYQADRDLTVRELLDRIAGRLDQTTGHPPLVEASIRQTIGSIYTELGDYTKAIRHYEVALRLQREQLGGSHPQTLRSLCGLAMARWWSGDAAQAEPLTRQGLETSRRALGEKHPQTLQFMRARASTLMFLGEMPWDEVERYFLQALALHREVLGPDDPETLRLIYALGIGYVFNWQATKLEPLLVDALERSRRVLGEQHPLTSGLTALGAATYFSLNHNEQAEKLAFRNVEMRRNVLGDDHPLTMSAELMLATIYVQQQQFEKAAPIAEQALKLSQRLAIENSPFTVHNLSALSFTYLEQGRITNANRLCEVALAALRRKPDIGPLLAPRIITCLGAVRLAQQKYAEAEMLLREASPLWEKYWPDTAYRFSVMSMLGASLMGQTKYAEAEPLLLQGCEGLLQRQAGMPPHLKPARRITESLERLVRLYEAWGKPVQAAEWKKKLTDFQQAGKI